LRQPSGCPSKPVAAAFGDLETVRRYAAALRDLSVQEQEQRLDLLREFSVWVERTPDEMVDELFDTVSRKYRKRGFYTQRIREFSMAIPGTWAEQNFRGNVIRSFFIANGYRIVPEKPPWM